MSTRNNIAAHTAVGSDFPPYISINEVQSGVEITIRSAGGRGAAREASIVLSCADYLAFIRSAADPGLELSWR